MNKAGWIAGFLLLIVALGSAYVIIRPSQEIPSEDTGMTGNATVGANGASTIITYTDAGFSPSPQTVSPGTTVTWVNQSSHPMWVETDTHTGDCPTTSKTVLNECQTVGKGGSYSYTFTALGTFAYLNHARYSDSGVIVVTNASSSGPINPSAQPE